MRVADKQPDANMPEAKNAAIVQTETAAADAATSSGDCSGKHDERVQQE